MQKTFVAIVIQSTVRVVKIVRANAVWIYEVEMQSKKFVLVSGSRGFASSTMVRETIRGFLKPGDTLMHGDAHGVDTWAAQAAAEIGAHTVARPANWDKYGRRAGIMRNRQMLDEAMGSGLTVVLIFWDGYSKGTKHMLELCARSGAPYLLWVE